MEGEGNTEEEGPNANEEVVQRMVEPKNIVEFRLGVRGDSFTTVR